MKKIIPALMAALAVLPTAGAYAQSSPDMGKLLATGGVIQVEGAGGGGITPWALGRQLDPGAERRRRAQRGRAGGGAQGVAVGRL